MNSVGLESIISNLPLKQMLPNPQIFLLKTLLMANKKIPKPELEVTIVSKWLTRSGRLGTEV